MRLVCISDTHMAHRGIHLPEGDVLIHAGDATSCGSPDEVDRFLNWFAAQPHPRKILIAGNHDWLYQRDPDIAKLLLEQYPGITYLEDSGVEIDGIKFWGSPWQPWFMSWAFNLARGGENLRHVWNLIPIDTDVLITHGPPHGILDQIQACPPGQEDGPDHMHLGCEELKIRLAAVQPRVHVFGHIHGSYGVAQSKTTTYVNACTCTEAYRALNRPIALNLTKTQVKVLGIAKSDRQKHLDKAKALVDLPGPSPMRKAECWTPEAQLTALREMAAVRGLTPEDLIGEYALRGLQADLAKFLKAEGKASKRPIPFHKLDEV